MDIALFKQFLEVSRQGSFAAAAKILGKDPSSISRAIAQLEEELRVRLFNRTTRHISLTAAGQNFLRRIEGVIAEIDAIKDEVRAEDSTPAGLVRMSASVAFGQKCILPHLNSFQKRYPDLRLDLKLTDRNVDLVAEQIDFAIRLAPSLDIDVIARKLLSTRYRVLASPEYLAKSGPVKTPDDLEDHQPLCFDLPIFREKWIFRDRLGEERAVDISPSMTISSALALREAAIMGMGPTLLADWLIEDDIESGRLVDLFPDYDVTATNFDAGAWLIYPSKAFLPSRTRIAMDFFQKMLTSASQ